MFQRLVLSLLAVLVVASAPASAARRYATPGADALTSGTCSTVQTACTLTHAVNDAATKDEIDVLTGRYAITETLQLPAGAYLHGHTSNLRPRIASSAPNVVLQTAGGTTEAIITDLAISGATATLLLVNGDARIERVVLGNDKDGGTAFSDAALPGALTLRSSIVRAAGSNAIAGAFRSSAAKVRNVTFYATGIGSRGVSSTCSSVDMVSSIAHGDGFDVTVDRLGCLGAASLNATNSSFQTKFEGGGATVTSGGGNIAADPATIFVNPGLGDFHELPGAPTIDKGAPVDKFSSPTDVDDFAWAGAVPDMGAAEYFGPTIETPTVTGITAARAVLTAPVSANGRPAIAVFETALPGGMFVRAGDDSTVVGPDAVQQPASVMLTDLSPETTYRARLNVAQGNFNYVRTFLSDEVTFTTAAVPTSRPKRCVVPKLKGMTLKRARATLKRARCRLGKVQGRRRGRGTARIRSQKRRVGRRLPVGTRVGVRVRYRRR